MGSNVGKVLCWTVLFLAVEIPVWGADIVELVSVVRKDKILVSFRMTDAFSDEVERAVESGLPVSFRFIVQLKKVRTVWLNQKVTTREISTTVTYDNLTERYKLSLEIDGEIQATDVVSDPEGMRRFMITLESLELFETSILEPNGEYYLRVKGVVRERNLFLFVPWNVGTGWTKKYFTYLP
jgi:hypothetical protein